jgi:hypothetical protein
VEETVVGGGGGGILATGRTGGAVEDIVEIVCCNGLERESGFG